MDRMMEVSAILIVVATIFMSTTALRDINDGRIQTVVDQLVRGN
jgi:hypothetical protein